MLITTSTGATFWLRYLGVLVGIRTELSNCQRDLATDACLKQGLVLVTQHINIFAYCFLKGTSEENAI